MNRSFLAGAFAGAMVVGAAILLFTAMQPKPAEAGPTAWRYKVISTSGKTPHVDGSYPSDAWEPVGISGGNILLRKREF